MVGGGSAAGGRGAVPGSCWVLGHRLSPAFLAFISFWSLFQKMGYTFQEIPIFIFIGVLGKQPFWPGELTWLTPWLTSLVHWPFGEEPPLAMRLCPP